MAIPPDFRRRWWLDFSYDWLTCRRPQQPGDRLDPAAKYFRVTCQLDWDGGDFSCWLGWLGFRCYYLVEQPWEFSGQLSSGYSFYWGRAPLVEGARLGLHEESHCWRSNSPRLRQVSVAGQFVIMEAH